MAGITLAQAEAQLALYLAAEAAVLANQSYEITTPQGTRRLTRANLDEIQAGIKAWDERAKDLEAQATSGSGSRLRTVVAAR